MSPTPSSWAPRSAIRRAQTSVATSRSHRCHTLTEPGRVEARDVLRAAAPELALVRVEYGLVFPNTTGRRGELPPDLHPAQFMTCTFFDDPADAVDRLMCLRWGGQRLESEGVAAVVQVLRPNCELDWDDGASSRRARQRMDDLCEQRVHAVEELDANRHVLVTGWAGSGKTRLALAWARRAVGRAERVLLTCYNDRSAPSWPSGWHPTRGSRSGRSTQSPGH